MNINKVGNKFTEYACAVWLGEKKQLTTHSIHMMMIMYVLMN